MSPARDERRQAVLGLLATHGAVTWHGYGQDVAFADEVLELAARLGRVETVPAMRPVRVALSADLSDEQGERAHGDGATAQGSSAGNEGGKR